MRRSPWVDALFPRRVTEEVPGESAGNKPPFPGSASLRHVDAGSCNDCEVEIGQAFAPPYDAGRFGIRLVACPCHADGFS